MSEPKREGRNAVVLVADKNMFPPAAFLAKRLAELRSTAEVDILLISDWGEGLAEARRMGLPAVLRNADFGLVEAMGSFRPSRILPAASYYRISLPRLLATDYARILCLDVDTYPMSERLFDLFALDLNGRPVAAARAVAVAFDRRSHDIKDVDRRQLNAGVLLIDTATYLERSIEERMWETIRSLPAAPELGDQEIFNRVLGNDWLELSPRFNTNFQFARSEIAETFPPEILHFIGLYKQWTTPSPAEGHPARNELGAFLADTAWSGFFNDSRNRNAQFKSKFRSIARGFGLPTEDKFGPKRLAELDLDLPGLLHFLRTTEFADVAQGLTKPNLDRLPKLGATIGDAGTGL